MSEPSLDIGLARLGPDCAERPLGGTIVYAPTERVLQREIERLSELAIEIVAGNPSIDRKYLLNQVRSQLGVQVERRLLSAVVGLCLRMGNLEVIPCEAVSGRTFRIIVAQAQVTTFWRRVEEVGSLLQADRRLRIRDIRDHYWGKAPGTWTYASHVAGATVLRGWAEYLDKYTLAWPEGLPGALRKAIS